MHLKGSNKKKNRKKEKSSCINSSVQCICTVKVK